MVDSCFGDFMSDLWILFGMFVLGSLFGSYMNVMIFRIPAQILADAGLWESTGEKVIRGNRSACRYCEAPIPGWLNIPIFSWLMLGGKTKCCKKPLSLQYPVVETLVGIVFVLIYWKFSFIELYPTLDIAPRASLQFLHATAFSFLLIACSIIDYKHFLIPDVITIPMILTAPIVAYFHPNLSIYDSLFGILVGGGSLWLVNFLYKMVKGHDGMGFGDVKLLSAIGGWLGVQAIIPTLITASVVGTVIGICFILIKRGNMKLEIPFGPFLSLGALMHFFVGASFWVDFFS